MDIYNDICTNENKEQNTGAVNQCLEAVTVMVYLVKQGFAFADIAEFKSQSAWNDAIQNKDVVPLYEMYELTPNNTDAVYYESRNFRKRTTKAVKITNWEAYLGLCSHQALKSYENSSYKRVIEVTEDGDLMGVYAPDNVGVTGQLLSEFDVGIRTAATTEKNAFSPVTMTYDDYEELEQRGVLATPDFNPIQQTAGIFEVNIKQVGTGSNVSIQIEALVGCDHEYVPGLEDVLVLFDATGTLQTTTVSDDGDGLYTFTGTGLVSGYASTDGVQSMPLWGGLFVEGEGDVTVSA